MDFSLELEPWSPYQVLGHLTYIDECDWIDRTRVILGHGTERILQPVDREAGVHPLRGLDGSRSSGPWRELLPIVNGP